MPSRGLAFRYVNARLWSKAGHFNKALSKGPKAHTTTTWIWNLHASPHDFGHASLTRKVASSSLAHLSLVFLWLGGMHFHGAYFSNYSAWLKDPKHCLPSSHLVWSLVGQDILNGYNGQYFSGITITSGFFQLWRSEGIITETHLKYACAASLIGNCLCISGSYYHLRVNGAVDIRLKKLESCVAVHHQLVIFGLGCMSISGHQIHISLPINSLLDSGIPDPLFLELDGQATLCNPDLMQVIFPTFGTGPSVNFAPLMPFQSSIVGSATRLYNSSTASVPLAKVAAHHFALGVVFIISGMIGYKSQRQIWIPDVRSHMSTF
jgi:photosystem I P700 chlorophyll a apoprotein A1